MDEDFKLEFNDSEMRRDGFFTKLLFEVCYQESQEGELRMEDSDFKKYYFDYTHNLLWKNDRSNFLRNIQFGDNLEGKEIAKFLLQGLSHNPLKRSLDIHIPPINLEYKMDEISRYTGINFNNKFEYPIIEIIYGSLKSRLCTGESRPCIVAIEESLRLGAELEERGFDVLSYTYKSAESNHLPRILHASPVILEKLRIGNKFKRDYSRTLADNLEMISKT